MKNPRHQQVVMAYIENGGNKSAALKSCGYSDAYANHCSTKFFNNPKVQLELRLRKQKIIEKSQDRIEATEQWVIGQFMKEATAMEQLAPFMKIDEKNGSLYWDFRGATEEHLALIAELSVDSEPINVQMSKGSKGRKRVEVREQSRVTKFKIKVPDKHAALIALSRHLGLFNDKLKVESEESLIEKILEGRKRAGKPEEETDPNSIH